MERIKFSNLCFQKLHRKDNVLSKNWVLELKRHTHAFIYRN